MIKGLLPILAVLLANQAAFARPIIPPLRSCPALLAGMDRARVPEGGKTRQEMLYREHTIQGVPWHEVLVVEDFDTGKGLIMRLLYREVRRGAAPAGMDRPGTPEEIRAAHLAAATEIVTQNVALYDSRTKWDEESKEGYRKMADEYLEASVYCALYDKATGVRLAGKRHILAPYGIRNGKLVAEGHLVEKYFGPVTGFREVGEKQDVRALPRPHRLIPEADKLGIELPQQGVRFPSDPPGVLTGMHIEYGTLFVEKIFPDGRRVDAELNARIWAEMHLQDLRMAFSEPEEELNTLAKTLHAYADPAHRRIYTNFDGWGWDLLRSYTRQGKRISFSALDDRKAPTIPYGGSEWVPIIFHPERLEGYHKRFLDGQVRYANWVDLAARQKEMGGDLDRAELIESLDRLAAGFQSKDLRVTAASAVGLVRLTYRHDLYQKKLQSAKLKPEEEWRVPREASALEGVPERLKKLLDEAKARPAREDRILLLWLCGGLAQLELSHPSLTRAAISRDYFVPLLKDPDFSVRWSACAYARFYFSPKELKAFVPGRLGPYEAAPLDQELWQRRFGNPIFSDLAGSTETILSADEPRRPDDAAGRARTSLERARKIDPALAGRLFEAGLLTQPPRETRPEPRDRKKRAIGRLERAVREMEDAEQRTIDLNLYGDAEHLESIDALLRLVELRLKGWGAEHAIHTAAIASVEAEKEVLLKTQALLQAFGDERAHIKKIFAAWKAKDAAVERGESAETLAVIDREIERNDVDRLRHETRRFRALHEYQLARAKTAESEILRSELLRQAAYNEKVAIRVHALGLENEAQYSLRDTPEGEARESASRRLQMAAEDAELALQRMKEVEARNQKEVESDAELLQILLRAWRGEIPFPRLDVEQAHRVSLLFGPAAVR